MIFRYKGIYIETLLYYINLFSPKMYISVIIYLQNYLNHRQNITINIHKMKTTMSIKVGLKTESNHYARSLPVHFLFDYLPAR